jgi:hypothetical protein
MTNILIVESKNDKIFIEKLIEILNLDNIKVDKPICEPEDPINIDKYKCLNGLNQSLMVEALVSLSNSLIKNDINKIGLIIDQDLHTREQRLTFINSCVNEVFETSTSLDDINKLITVINKNKIPLQLGCYFTNVNGKGELETLLKAIRIEPSDYADCLEAWRECVIAKGKKISQKDFDKFWVSNYIRYDTCSRNESKQADRKCSWRAFDYVLKEKSHIFDFEDPVLNELKDFLKLFKD